MNAINNRIKAWFKFKLLILIMACMFSNLLYVYAENLSNDNLRLPVKFSTGGGTKDIDTQLPTNYIFDKFRKVIDSFTANERKLFEEALQVKGLKIGFDLERTLTCNYPEEMRVPKFYFQGGKSPYAIEDVKDIILRPGTIALVLGLLVNNEVAILTASKEDIVHPIIKNSVILEDLITSGIIKIYYAGDIKQISLQKMYKDTEASLKKEGVSEDVIERTKMISKYAEGIEWDPVLKVPSFFDLDLLVDDNSDLVKLYEEKFQMNPKWYIYIDGYSIRYDKEKNMFYTFLHTRRGEPINSNRHISQDTLDLDALDLLPIISAFRGKMNQIGVSGREIDTGI